MTKQIWLVWARRGDYSDRAEYPVCWYLTERDAKACAERMQLASANWRSRAIGATNPWSLVAPAQADIGDSQWSQWDDTDYSAFALERGDARHWKEQP